MENNDLLMKVHKEILDQKSKKERAQRELKLARRMAKQNITDKEFFTNFEVIKRIIYSLNIKKKTTPTERSNLKRIGRPKRIGITTIGRYG